MVWERSLRGEGQEWLDGSKSSLSIQIPHIKVGPEETPRLQYLRFASVSLYPSNEDVSLAVSRILKSFNYPSASLICAKAECEGESWVFCFPFLPNAPSLVLWSLLLFSTLWLELLGSLSTGSLSPYHSGSADPSCPRETHVIHRW